MNATLPVDLDARDIPVGAVLRRWYNDRLYLVRIVRAATTTKAAGRRGWWRYKYSSEHPAEPGRGKRWKSLSAIAYAITGDRYMSGNRFFGLRPRRGRCRRKLLQNG